MVEFSYSPNWNFPSRKFVKVSDLTDPESPAGAALSGMYGPRVPDYVAGRAYVVGELVVYSGVLYRITTAYTSSGGALDLSKATALGGGASLDSNGRLVSTQRPARNAPRVMRSGFWYGADAHLPTAAPPTMNVLNYVPLMVPHAVTLDRIGVEVTTTAASSVVRLGIYANLTATDTPGALILEAGTVDSSASTGAKEITISQALSPGLYWLAAVSQGGTPSLRSRGQVADPLIPQLGITTTASFGNNCLTDAGVSGALPSNGTGGGLGVIAPKIMVRIA